MSSFDDLKNNELYKHLIKMLTEEEQKKIEKTVKDMLNEFDEKITKIKIEK